MPEHFVEFCREWRKCFPLIYDTKLVSFVLTKDTKNNRSTLEDLFSKVQRDKLYFNNLKINFDTDAHIDFGQYQNGDKKPHDAAYDSYMTGVVFAMLTKRIEIE